MRHYAGVGSRQTPVGIQRLITLSANLLEDAGFILRSGGAEGADAAFERGVRDPSNKEIFYAGDSTPEAEKIAGKIHPNWDAVRGVSRRLHGRNVFQVLGRDLISPSRFVVCWTKDGQKVGGTRTAIVLAENYRIPVYNLGSEGGIAAFEDFLITLKPGIR